MTEDTLKPLSGNIHLLGRILGETISHFEGEKLFVTIEKLRRLAQKTRLGNKAAQREMEKELKSLSHAQKYKVAKAFTEFLRLANLCEQAHRIRRREHYQRSGELAQRASPRDTFSRLLRGGVKPAAIRRALEDVRIKLVLTAHPTEAMKPQSIRAYRDLSGLLLNLDSHEHTPHDRRMFHREIRSIVTQLWLSGVVRDRKPTPMDEARYGLELTESILWEAVPQFYHQVSAAYREAIGDMSRVSPRPIRFASWMGGDRDGHPGVTAATTRKVLQESSRVAIGKYLAALKELRDIFVFDSDARGKKLGEGCTKRLDAMTAKLALFRHDLFHGKPSFSSDEFMAMLEDLRKFLKANRAEELAFNPLSELVWRVRTFGLCLLKLDIRQDAGVHETVIAEFIKGYAAMDEDERAQALVKAIKKAGKPKPPKKLSATAQEALDTLRVYDEFPDEFLGPYIISMAMNPSDLLAVLFLLKAAGVKQRVSICPLFETPEALANAGDVMRKLYKTPVYKRKIGKRQEIMLGYSDSSKRSGYLNSAWGIYRLQYELTAIGRKSGVRTTFFHGRGGTIARGGGPIEPALLALPRPHLSRRIRLTEQGEAIYSKFGLPEVAQRTMELYLSGFLRALLSEPQEKVAAWTKTMERLAGNSADVFRDAVYENPDFIAHYHQITPTEELGLLKIGSRPGRRKKSGGLDSLRAIPWVFGWTQSRTLLPGWLGIGEAIETEIKNGNLKTLQDMYEGWPFFRSVLDLVEMVVAKADPQVTEYYSTMLVDPSLHHLTRDYLKRLDKTKKMLVKVMKRKKILEKQPVLARSIRIRSPYVDVLNILQAHLLKEYRGMKNPPADLARTLALTIGGISAGMRNTG